MKYDPYLSKIDPRQTITEIQSKLQEWINKQGHDRCWYYPEIFTELCLMLGVESKKPPNLPPRDEFECGCKRYADEQYKNTEQKMKSETLTISEFKKEYYKIVKLVQKAIDKDSEVTLGGNGINSGEAYSVLKSITPLVEKLKN